MLGALRMMRPPGEWSPLDLPDLVGWWDASDAATITSSGGAVSQWDDKSPGARHLAQSVAIQKFTTGNYTLNGLNTLDTETNLYYGAMSVTATFTVKTVYVAGFFVQTLSTYGQLVSGNGNNKFISVGSAGGFGSGGRRIFSYYSDVHDTAQHADNTAYIWGGTWTGTTGSLLSQNGVESSTFSSGLGGSVTSFTLGYVSDNTPAFRWGEVIVGSTNHDASQRAIVRSYLATKWGITL